MHEEVAADKADWQVLGEGARAGECGQTGDGTAELRKLPGRSEMLERSGEDGSSSDRLAKAG